MSSRPPSPVHRAAAGVSTAVGGALRASQQASQVLIAAKLAAAVYTGDLESLRALLAAGTSPDLPIPERPFTPLMVACGRDFLEGAQLLLDHGADLNAQAPGYGTPLTFALSSPRRALVPLLLEAGADPDRVPEGSSAPLLVALVERDEDSVRRLLEAGADPNARDAKGWSALAVALSEHLDVLAPALLARGARPDHPEPDGSTALSVALDGMLEPLALAMLEHPNLDPACFRVNEGRCLLDLAAAGGLLEAGARLLDLGLPVDGFPDQPVPPLHRALIYGQPAFADLLLARGATLTGGAQAPILRAAAFMGHLGCLEAGRARGMDLLAPELMEAAALGGSVPALAWFQAQGADLALIPDGKPLPTLHAAALRGRTEALRWLLAQGIPVDLQDHQKRSALRLALEEDAFLDATFGEKATRDPLSPEERLAAVEVLREAGADLAAEVRKDPRLVPLLLESGRTEVLLPLIERGLPLEDREGALLSASFRKDPALLQTFLQQGFPVAAADPHGETGLHIASALDHAVHVDLLVAAGLPVDVQDRRGLTPLLRACLEGARSAVERLLAHGANPNVQDPQGWTPLMLAAHGGHAALAQLLLKHGAKRQTKNQDGATALTYAKKLKRKDLMKLLG